MDSNLSISTSIVENFYPYKYSICTLVTQIQEYKEMLESFINAGFTKDICEFLHIDNSISNKHDAYQGVNLFLKQAKGEYIIICHQDILIDKDKIDVLNDRIEELNKIDENWALCGNAGAAAPNHIVYHISYPNNLEMSKGHFPAKVKSLDENFILVKNSSQLSTSSGLKGFHLYATDLCLQASLKGYTAYAISFMLTHKSRGNKNESFFKLREQLVKNYNNYLRTQWVQTNSTVFHLSGNFLGKLCGNPLSLFFVRMYNGIKKRL